MRQIALIRCARIGAEEKRLRQQLATVFSTVAYVVDDMGGQHPTLQKDAVRLGVDFVAGAGLRIFPGVGWQCGDYAYYAARQALPDFDFAWMIEPDVGFTFPRLTDFFDLFASDRSDFLAPHFGPRGDWWYWAESITPLVGAGGIHGCAFPISRLSARAIDLLAVERRALFAALPADVDPRAIPNDESFTASILMRDGFVCGDLEALSPHGSFSPDSFGTAMLVMPDELRCPAMQNRVLHSVRTGPAACGRMRQLRLQMPDTWATMRERVIANLGREAWCRWTLPSRL